MTQTTSTTSEAQLVSEAPTVDNALTPGSGYGATTSNLPAGTVPTLGERIDDVLWLMGINPSSNPQAVANLIAQSNYEYPSGPVGNNLLGTTLKINGSTSTNGAGVQSYNSWQDGVYAAALMLSQSSNAPAASALASNASANDYATALSQSTWEGFNPKSAAANAAYGQAFLERYTSLFNSGKLPSLASAAVAANDATGTAGGANPESDFLPGNPAATGLSSLFGLSINLGEVGTIAIGIALIIVGLIFFFHKDASKLIPAALA